jgi:hypothetical protein
MNFWCWLNSYSAAVQSIAALCSALLALFTILVLIVTWKSIKRQAAAAVDQAEAARALTKVAKEQTRAAVDTAESARRQSELLLSQIEQNTAPLLVAEPDDRYGVNLRNGKLVNRGPGVAFQIFFWQGGLDAREQGSIPITNVEPSTLGPGNFAELRVPFDWEVFTVRYKGVDREERWTVVYRDPGKGQDHWVKKGLQIISLT